MKTVLSVKVDEETKKRAQEVAASAGISVSTLVNAYLRQISATRRIDLYIPEQASPKLEKLIESVEAEISRGDVSEGFSTVDDFLADLNK